MRVFYALLRLVLTVLVTLAICAGVLGQSYDSENYDAGRQYVAPPTLVRIKQPTPSIRRLYNKMVVKVPKDSVWVTLQKRTMRDKHGGLINVYDHDITYDPAKVDVNQVRIMSAQINYVLGGTWGHSRPTSAERDTASRISVKVGESSVEVTPIADESDSKQPDKKEDSEPSKQPEHKSEY